MTDNQIQRKRPHDETEDEPNSKRPKWMKGQPAPFFPSLSTLNDLCLEHIFRNLDVIDLVNVSHVMDQRARDVAGYVYKRMFGHHNIEFDADAIYVIDTTKTDEHKIAATIADMRGLLEHFGPYIDTIDIFDYNKALHDGLEPMLLERCTDTLKSMGIFGELDSTEILFETIGVPFKKLKRLSLQDIQLNAHSAQLHKWFPNVRNLKIDDVKSFDPDYMVHHFVNLTTFWIESRSAIDIPGLIKMFALNPQLIELKMDHQENQTGEHLQVDRQLLDGIAGNLPNLKILTMIPLNVSIPERMRGHMHTAGQLGAVLPEAIVDDSRKPIPFTLDRLQSLHLSDCAIWNTEWTKFVARHANLKELTIDCSRFVDLPVNIEEIASRLPDLCELRVLGCSVNIYNIDWILAEHKSIYYLEVERVYDVTIGDVLNIELFTVMDYAANWTISEDSSCVYFERKVL